MNFISIGLWDIVLHNLYCHRNVTNEFELSYLQMKQRIESKIGITKTVVQLPALLHEDVKK